MPHILYSYRRCPFAIRARCALLYAQIPFEIREIDLKAKPQSMLAISPKGTVPVLLTQELQVIDESLEIMYWALQQQDHNHWLPAENSEQGLHMRTWLEINDGPFKKILDAYKYPERQAGLSRSNSLSNACELMLQPLNQFLERGKFLQGEHMTLLDIALLPFIRQFAAVDPEAFKILPLKALSQWLNFMVLSDLFHESMAKYPLWKESEI